MQKLLFFVLAIGFFMTACKKTEAPIGFNGPVFKVGFVVDSLDTITAGLDNVYLFTNYDLDDGVFHSVNAFSDVACPAGDCPGSLRFEFTGNPAFDSAFLGGIYTYTIPDSISQNPMSYTTKFNWGDLFGKFPEQTFTFLGNDTVTYSSPTQTVSLSLQDGPKEILLEAEGANGLHCSIVRTVLPSAPHAYPGVTISATPVGMGYELAAFEDFSGPAVNIYHWNTGDSTVTIFVDSVASISSYKVTVTDDTGKTASAGMSSLPFNPQAVIKSAFVTFLVTPVFNTQQTGTVAIQWVDSEGIIWRSDRKNQSSFASFEVLESEMYEPNEKGDEVWKLNVKFTCLLYTEGGESRAFSGEGVIAMARP